MAKASHTKKVAPKKATPKAAPAKKTAPAKPAAKPQAPPPSQSHQLTMDEKKAWALKLFVLGTEQKEIARVVQVSQNTISKWANDPVLNWDAHKKSVTATRQEIMRRLYKVLDKVSKKVDDDPEGGTPKDADMIIKYNTAIQILETEANAAHAIEVFMAFNKYMLSIDPGFLQQATYYQDLFVTELLKRF